MSEIKCTPFSQQLAYINKGTLDKELTEALAEVIKMVRETGKKGAVTLTLNCQMLNTRDENTMKITPNVKKSIPELDRADTIMFSTADGDLMRDDPSQVQMDLTVINTGSAAAPIKLQSHG
jgi:ribosomal protein S28E/S33